MQSWLKVSLLLCIFGFLKELRPSEPFVYEFLIGEWRNVTEEQVSQDVYPVGTYAYLAQLVVVFLITDLCRYKPLIIALALSGVVVWSMLLWTESLLELQILEVRNFLFKNKRRSFVYTNFCMFVNKTMSFFVCNCTISYIRIRLWQSSFVMLLQNFGDIHSYK